MQKESVAQHKNASRELVEAPTDAQYPAWVALLGDADLAKYARTRHAFTRHVPPLPRSRTLERGASHKVASPDGEYSIDHAGCPSKEVQQLHSARKRGVHHRKRARNSTKAGA